MCVCGDTGRLLSWAVTQTQLLPTTLLLPSRFQAGVCEFMLCCPADAYTQPHQHSHNVPTCFIFSTRSPLIPVSRSTSISCGVLTRLPPSRQKVSECGKTMGSSAACAVGGLL